MWQERLVLELREAVKSDSDRKFNEGIESDGNIIYVVVADGNLPFVELPEVYCCMVR